MNDYNTFDSSVLTADEIDMLAEITNPDPQEKQFFILIVDDDQRVRESLKALLAIYDMNSTLAKDGQQALEYLDRDYFDLILLDLEMPKVDGFQVMEEIKNHHPKTDIIILSGENSYENVRKVWHLGAQDFLKKPYNPAELIELIQKIREKRRLDSEKITDTVDNNTQRDVDNTLRELENIIHNETLTFAHEIINSSPVVAILWKNISDWHVQFVSENVFNVLGYSTEEFYTGKVCYKNIIHPDDVKLFIKAMEKEVSTNFKHKPHRLITKSGVVIWIEITTSVVRDKDGEIAYYQGIIIDVTERELSRQKLLQKQTSLEHIAHHDALTGLPNRLLLMDRLHQAIKTAQRTKKVLAVFYIDLDKFKSINDSLGHAAGDDVLITAAKRLRQSVRTVDTIARIGGDEFIVLMESVSHVQDVKTMAEKLIYSLRRSMHWNAHELFVTSSIGISLAPKDGNTPEELMKKADIAMYQSKEKNGNTFQFYFA
jgi:diguanylate cyclase (GGDEF)-like protein/PAS domain S-box-containing protein